MRLPGLLAITACLAWSADKIPEGTASDSTMNVSARLFVDRAAIKSALGSDLDGNFVVVEVTVEPKRKYTVARDAFLLRTDRDGEKSTPFTGSQIAGRSALVLKPIPSGGGSVMSQDRGPVYGGIGGNGPGQLGNQGTAMGSAASQSGSSSATYTTSGQRDPLQATLDEKIFPEVADQPSTGLLYFPMEPKQKAKQLELIVTTPKGKLFVRFR